MSGSPSVTHRMSAGMQVLVNAGINFSSEVQDPHPTLEHAPSWAFDARAPGAYLRVEG